MTDGTIIDEDETTTPTQKAQIDNINTFPPRKRRQRNYWEPIYDPSDSAAFPKCDWNFTHNIGARHCICTAEDLKSAHAQKTTVIIDEITFAKCDFFGAFEQKVVFTNCSFEGCDFGLSQWRNAKFTGCQFNRCSFTMSTFESCEFRECSWKEIGISGNETKLPKTIITNPNCFIKAAYTNLDQRVLEGKGKTPQHQIMRLEQTKAVLSKILVHNLNEAGEDKSYYDAIKTYLNQSLDAKIAETKHTISEKKNFLYRLLLRSKIGVYKIEKAILRGSGSLNDWGNSIARPAFVGILIMLAFSAIYYGLGVRDSFPAALMASLDITLLVGYTKHSARGMPQFAQGLYTLNMVFGLWWYAVFVPTVINRISRVR